MLFLLLSLFCCFDFLNQDLLKNVNDATIYKEYEFVEESSLASYIIKKRKVLCSGEPFTEVGVKLKETDGFALILPCALTNGYEGYFPTLEASIELKKRKSSMLKNDGMTA